MSKALALPDPSTTAIAVLHERCGEILQWIAQTDDLPRLNEARRWLSAVEEYLEKKKAAGPAQTANRLLEARIGELLPPADEAKGGRGKKASVATEGLSYWERYEFRLMAQRRELWMPRLPCSRKEALRRIRDDEADMRPIPERPVELLLDIRYGDFRKVFADVPDESVDLILTDPPYPAEFLPLWSDLAIFARRVLAPTGMLAALSGQLHLPEVYQRLGEHLKYRWTMAYLMAGAANVVHARRVSTMWKPVLVFGSTQRRLHDVATSKEADKDFHGWGQSESGMYQLLRLLADPGALVCDPFLGGGTTAIVARAHGCHFIGAEVDDEAYRTAKGRLAA